MYWKPGVLIIMVLYRKGRGRRSCVRKYEDRSSRFSACGRKHWTFRDGPFPDCKYTRLKFTFQLLTAYREIPCNAISAGRRAGSFGFGEEVSLHQRSGSPRGRPREESGRSIRLLQRAQCRQSFLSSRKGTRTPGFAGSFRCQRYWNPLFPHDSAVLGEEQVFHRCAWNLYGTSA